MKIKEIELRKLVSDFVAENPAAPKKIVVKRFADLGFSRRTIYSILKRIENNIGVERNPGSGHKHRKLKQSLKASIKRATVGKVIESLAESSVFITQR
jgi:hypothetical protein